MFSVSFSLSHHLEIPSSLENVHRRTFFHHSFHRNNEHSDCFFFFTGRFHNLIMMSMSVMSTVSIHRFRWDTNSIKTAYVWIKPLHVRQVFSYCYKQQWCVFFSWEHCFQEGWVTGWGNKDKWTGRWGREKGKWSWFKVTGRAGGWKHIQVVWTDRSAFIDCFTTAQTICTRVFK